MRFAVVAHRNTETNEALAAAARSLGVAARRAHAARGAGLPRAGRRRARPARRARGADGMESGELELEWLAAGGVVLLNPPGALAAAHDKLLTARAPRSPGLPHPHTSLIAAGAAVARAGATARPETALRRLGPGRHALPHAARSSTTRSPGLRSVAGSATARSRRSWCRRWAGILRPRRRRPGGRLRPPCRRSGEWRTNVALGGRARAGRPPPLARALARRGRRRSAPTSSASTCSDGGRLRHRRAERRGRRPPLVRLRVGDVYGDAVFELLRAARDHRACWRPARARATVYDRNLV